MVLANTKLEIKYCIAWGYLPQAAWIAAEFFSEFQARVAISITPVDDGRLEVYLDGKTIFDRKAEGGKYPDMERVREMKASIRKALMK